METIRVKVENHSANDLPTYATEQSSGLDLRSKDTKVIPSHSFEFFDTGIHIEIPEGYEAQVRPRSGLARKGVMAAFGTIDADYRGPIGVTIYNYNGLPFRIEAGERIAQLVISPVAHAELIQVEKLSETKRGNGGFGSTGMK